MDGEKPTDLTTRVLVDIRDELKGLRGDVDGLKGEMHAVKGEVQGLRGEAQGLKGEMQGVRSELHEHGVVIQELVQVVGHQGVTLKQILRAVERCASERRDDRVDTLEERVDRLEQHVGLPRR